MKNITKLILPAVLAFALLLTGCPQAGTKPGKNSGTNPAVPSNPNELVEADVLTAFGLTKGNITASAAAKKIEAGTPASVSGITFTTRTAVSYDDQAGTFTVKVKGTKNGKDFEKEITAAGFTNPYAANPQSMDTTDNKGGLKLDEGIEHNHSIAKYVEKANLNIANFFKAPLTFSLVNGTSITLGDFPGYELTATLEEAGADKVKIVPMYTVKNHKKVAGGADTVKKEQKYSVFPSRTFEANLTKPYFTEQDVFAHVLSKTPDSVIKAYPNEFASSFYATAKLTGASPNELFDYNCLEPYKTIYQIKDPDEYMHLDITCGIADPKNGGIDADDYKGELTVRFCVAKQEDLADQSKDKPARKITRSGYAAITDADVLNQHIFFSISSKPSPSSENKQSWKNKQFDGYMLLRVTETGAVTPKPIKNPLPDGVDKPFCLCVNGTDNLASQLGCKNFGASLTKNGKIILIENISLKKQKNEMDLEVQVQLKGSGSPLTIKINPGEAYR